MKQIKCAFCKGRGKDPFNLLSELASCQVCGGSGAVKVLEPAVKCAFCRGSGVYPHNARVTCTVCKGKGMVTVRSEKKECAKCKGKGVSVDSGLPCVDCGGKGIT
jgi:DnaJ-class molecular chaperone